MLKSYIMNTDGNVQLTKHFKVKEFACKDGSPVVFIDDYLYNVLVILMNNQTKVKPQYSVVVFLGRLEPVHVAHVASIMEAFKHGEYVIVGLGTANSPRTPLS